MLEFIATLLVIFALGSLWAMVLSLHGSTSVECTKTGQQINDFECAYEEKMLLPLIEDEKRNMKGSTYPQIRVEQILNRKGNKSYWYLFLDTTKRSTIPFRLSKQYWKSNALADKDRLVAFQKGPKGNHIEFQWGQEMLILVYASLATITLCLFFWLWPNRRHRFAFSGLSMLLSPIALLLGVWAGVSFILWANQESPETMKL